MAQAEIPHISMDMSTPYALVSALTQAALHRKAGCAPGCGRRTACRGVQRKMWCPFSLKCRRQSRMPSSFVRCALHPSGSSSGLHSHSSRVNALMQKPAWVAPSPQIATRCGSHSQYDCPCLPDVSCCITLTGHQGSTFTALMIVPLHIVQLSSVKHSVVFSGILRALL